MNILKGWRGVKFNSVNVDEKAKNNVKYNYCYVEENTNGYNYTKIRVFFKFNLPVIGDIMDYGVNGKTSLYKGYNKTINKGYN